MCLRVLFLWEQVRDLRVQEFQCELVVGVAGPSDPVGSFFVKILHSVEGDVEQGCSNLETNLPCWRLLSLSLSLSLSHLWLHILHAYIAYIFICLIYLVLYCYMFGIVCSHLYSAKRAIHLNF